MRALLVALPLLAAFLLVPAVEAAPVGACTVLKPGDRCHLMLACAWTDDGTEACVPDPCARTVCW